MITRSDYMNGKATHDQYYADIVKAIGGPDNIQLPFSVERIREALSLGDEHLNSLPLINWDAFVPSLTGASSACKERGDRLSLATGVCILKCAAKMKSGLAPYYWNQL